MLRKRILGFIILLLCFLPIPILIYFYYIPADIFPTSESPLKTPIITVYRYVSSDLGFEDIEVVEKGRSLEIVEKLFEEYKSLKDDPTISLLIATAPSDWDDMSHRRWEYTYKELTEEEERILKQNTLLIFDTSETKSSD